LIGTVAGRANRTPFASGSLPRGCGQSVSWLAEAIEASGAMAEALLAILELADQIAERNKIIGDNWAERRRPARRSLPPPRRLHPGTDRHLPAGMRKGPPQHKIRAGLPEFGR